MPTLPYVANGAQVAIKNLVAGQECLITFHVLGPLGFSNEDLDELCEVVGQRAAARLYPGMSFIASLGEVTARGIRYEGDASGLYVPPTDVEGGVANETQRPQEACCIKVETGRTGAGYNGRNFLPAIPGNVVFEGKINFDYRTGRAAALQAFYLDIRGMTPFNPVIISYWREKTIRPTPIATPITKCVSKRVAPSYLSSRDPGSGN